MKVKRWMGRSRVLGGEMVVSIDVGFRPSGRGYGSLEQIDFFHCSHFQLRRLSLDTSFSNPARTSGVRSHSLVDGGYRIW